MTVQNDPASTPATSPLRVLGTLTAGMVLGAAALAVFAYLTRAENWNHISSSIFARRTGIDTSSPAVVDKIRQLSRLETVDYSLDKIVEGERGSPYIPDILVGDKILLVAHGEVIAGVDLSQLKPADVSVSGDTVHVRLPDSQVLTTRVDNQRTRIFSRSTGLLIAPDPDLETEVRKAAEDQITKAALADGILDKAQQNARNSVTALLYGLGFHIVDVR